MDMLKASICFILLLGATAALLHKKPDSEAKKYLKTYGSLVGAHTRYGPVKRTGQRPTSKEKNNSANTEHLLKKFDDKNLNNFNGGQKFFFTTAETNGKNYMEGRTRNTLENITIMKRLDRKPLKRNRNKERRAYKRLTYGQRHKILSRSDEARENFIKPIFEDDSRRRNVIGKLSTEGTTNHKPTINFLTRKFISARMVPVQARKLKHETKEKLNSTPTSDADEWKLSKKEVNEVLEKIESIEHIMKLLQTLDNSTQLDTQKPRPVSISETANSTVQIMEKPAKSHKLLWILLGMVIFMLKVILGIYLCFCCARKRKQMAERRNEVPPDSCSIDLSDVDSEEILFDCSDLEEYKRTSVFSKWSVIE